MVPPTADKRDSFGGGWVAPVVVLGVVHVDQSVLEQIRTQHLECHQRPGALGTVHDGCHFRSNRKIAHLRQKTVISSFLPKKYIFF